MHYVDPNELLIINDDDVSRDLSFVEAHEVQCTYISIIPSSVIRTSIANTSVCSNDTVENISQNGIMDWSSITLNIVFYGFFTGLFIFSIYLLVLLVNPSN